MASLLNMQILEKVHGRGTVYNSVHLLLCFITTEERENCNIPFQPFCRFPSSRYFIGKCWPCTLLRGGPKCSSMPSSNSLTFYAIFFVLRKICNFLLRIIYSHIFQKKVLWTLFLICIGRLHWNDSIQVMFSSYTVNNYKSNILTWHIHILYHFKDLLLMMLVQHIDRF